jgi:hypothetical protein
MRFARRREGPHHFTQNNHGPLYRRYRASQRRSCPKINICEIFAVIRFSTFSTISALLRHADRP